MPSVTEAQSIPFRFGELAVLMGLVTEKQLEEACRKQNSLRMTGSKSRLGEVLIQQNVLTVEQVKKVLSEQRKRRTAEADEALPMEYFGEYKLLAKLGEGGMGTVYKAKETLAERLVALKVLRKTLAGNQKFTQRFDREAKLAGSLNHANVVSCFSAGVHRGIQYISMEYIEGETLKQRMNRKGGKLPEEESLKYALQIAQGLSHAHSKGVVHRDIKPDNVLLGKNGAVKISDFGTAKSFLDEESMTNTGVIVGTPNYISPEQVRGEKNIDHRADLYALGATLYQMLTGRLPFSASSALQIMRAHLEDELENPADINPLISGEAVQIVTKLMAKTPDARYKSADDLAEDIQRVLEKKAPLHATLSQNESSIRAPQRRPRARKRESGCMGILLLATVVLKAGHLLLVRAL